MKPSAPRRSAGNKAKLMKTHGGGVVPKPRVRKRKKR